MHMRLYATSIYYTVRGTRIWLLGIVTRGMGMHTSDLAERSSGAGVGGG